MARRPQKKRKRKRKIRESQNLSSSSLLERLQDEITPTTPIPDTHEEKGKRKE